MEDEGRFLDEDRQFTGPEGAERGEDEDAAIAAPEEPAAVDEDDVTGEGLRRSGGLEERLVQEEPDRDDPRRPAVEEPKDVGWREEPFRDEAGRLEEGDPPGATDGEGDPYVQEP